MKIQASLRAPGSCGELVQGTIGGQDFLISCPIDLYSQVEIELSPLNQGIRANIPAEKTRRAVRQALQLYNKSYLGATITINSQLIRGKGMASSTADITAALGAVMLALGRTIDLVVLKRIALEIEATDGTFLPGLSLFDHKHGSIISYLGKPPALDILVFTERGQVDTSGFNLRRDLAKLNKDKEDLVKEALLLVKKGIAGNNPRLLGRGATLSSLAHQSILYKPSLNRLLKVVQGNEMVYGVNIAHSGTLLGVLIKRAVQTGPLRADICQNCPDIEFIRRTSLISGGFIFKEGRERDGLCPEKMSRSLNYCNGRKSFGNCL